MSHPNVVVMTEAVVQDKLDGLLDLFCQSFTTQLALEKIEYDGECPLSFPEIALDGSIYTEILKHMSPVEKFIPVFITDEGKMYWGYAEDGYLCFNSGVWVEYFPCVEDAAFVIVPMWLGYWYRGYSSVEELSSVMVESLLSNNIETLGLYNDFVISAVFAEPESPEQLERSQERCEGEYIYGDGLLVSQIWPEYHNAPILLFVDVSLRLQNLGIYGYATCRVR